MSSISKINPINKASILLAILLLAIAVVGHAQIIVSELQPFRLGRWTIGSGNIAANQDICVALRPRGPYSVTAGGDSLNGEFCFGKRV